VTKNKVSGKPTHDVRLVALMKAHSLERLLTLNPADFKRFDIEIVTPTQP
jgi:predicted nucleic acid-binding protein